MAKKNKRNESYLSIRKKLIAAVAMLLVASFMVASSSYAWFTLSTAPEVTGIQTTVGANGSLEIALIGTQGNLPGESQVGDGAEEKTINEKNITWGNIVDLADAAYGLENIILKPARLNVSVNAGVATLTNNILSVPEYGADGRITQLNATNTVSGIYNNSAFGVGGYGVRAVGTTTTMTRQQLVFNSAKSAAIRNVANAKSTAVNSLTTYGPKLAKVLTAKAVDDDGTKTYDLTCVAGILTDLQAANNSLEKAIRAYYDALVAKALESVSDTEYNAAIAALALEDKELSALITGTGITAPTGVTLTWPAAQDGTTVKEAYDLWLANDTALKAAQTAYDAKNGAVTELLWADVNTILITSGLVNIEQATLNGFSASEVKNNVDKIMASYLKDGVTVKFGEGSGVYANIARATSDYMTNVTFEQGTTVTVPGSTSELDLDGMKAVMEVETGTPKYNVSANGDQTDVTAVWGATPADRGQDADATIADAYAYMIDLAFRTNASDSKLQLQTEATGRIYGNDGGTEETMGGGATMTFQSQDPAKFSTGQVQSLMQAVRIVFVDADYNIIAVGALDTNAAKVEGLEVTADIKLVNYTIEDDGQISYTTTTTTGEGESAVTTTAINWKADASIMDLQQNTPHKLSVLVFLDGDKVTNADVATGDYSVTGTLNLQFSSNAELKPMEYANLMNADGTVSDGDEDDDTPAASTNIQLANTGLVAAANVAQSMTTAQTLVLPAKSATDKDITWTETTDESNVGTLDSNNLTANGAGTVVLGYSYAGEAEGDPAVTGTVTVTVTAAAAGGESQNP